MSDEPDIVVTENGPYQVNADLPITPRRVVTSERGEPLTSITEAPLDHDTPTWICRCGHSGHKPFCDGSHKRVGFVGTETAAREPFTERQKSYQGTNLTIHRVGALCAHSGFCANAVTDWYRLLPATDDTNVRAEVISMVEHCPSGALVMEIDGEIVEPALPRSVSPAEDGPYWVLGGVSIASADGTGYERRNRVALCRCGESKNKPFCDGTHIEIGFRAPNPRPEPAPKPSDEPPVAPVYRDVILGVQSATEAEILAVAAMVAGATGARVSLVHAGSRGRRAEAVLGEAAARLREAGVGPDRITTALRPGVPTTVLREAAVASDAGLMILGRGGDRIAPITEEVSHGSPCDVLVVARRGEGRPDRYRRILIASDGSKTADRAARRGYDLARGLAADVFLVFVGHPETGDLIISDTMAVYGGDVPTETRTLQGEAAEEILAAAAEVDADLIVIGNRGMAQRKLLGRRPVPQRVLAGARSDVLLCRTVRQRQSELEPGDGGIIERDGEQLAAYVDDAGELHLMSARCTHLGCVVGWNPVDRTFDCPCHGSRFRPTGEVLAGPAARPLDPA